MGKSLYRKKRKQYQAAGSCAKARGILGMMNLSVRLEHGEEEMGGMAEWNPVSVRTYVNGLRALSEGEGRAWEGFKQVC